MHPKTKGNDTAKVIKSPEKNKLQTNKNFFIMKTNYLFANEQEKENISFALFCLSDYGYASDLIDAAAEFKEDYENDDLNFEWQYDLYKLVEDALQQYKEEGHKMKFFDCYAPQYSIAEYMETIVNVME